MAGYKAILLLLLATSISAAVLKPIKTEATMACGDENTKDNAYLCNNFNGGGVCSFDVNSEPKCVVVSKTAGLGIHLRKAKGQMWGPEKPTSLHTVLFVAKQYAEKNGHVEMQEKVAERESLGQQLLTVFDLFDFPQCPVDVPMCRRVKCGGYEAHNNGSRCLSDPRCCFDQDLYLYKKAFGSEFMKDSPTCYYGPTSTTYQDITSTILPWNPWYSSVVVDFYESVLIAPSSYTKTNQACENFGQAQKTCGWEGITEMECSLKECCYTSTGLCVYPSDKAIQYLAGKHAYPELRSSDEAETQCNANPFESPKIYNRIPCQKIDSSDPYSVLQCHADCCSDRHAFQPALRSWGLLTTIDKSPPKKPAPTSGNPPPPPPDYRQNPPPQQSFPPMPFGGMPPMPSAPGAPAPYPYPYPSPYTGQAPPNIPPMTGAPMPGMGAPPQLPAGFMNMFGGQNPQLYQTRSGSFPNGFNADVILQIMKEQNPFWGAFYADKEPDMMTLMAMANGKPMGSGGGFGGNNLASTLAMTQLMGGGSNPDDNRKMMLYMLMSQQQKGQQQGPNYNQNQNQNRNYNNNNYNNSPMSQQQKGQQQGPNYNQNQNQNRNYNNNNNYNNINNYPRQNTRKPQYKPNQYSEPPPQYQAPLPTTVGIDESDTTIIQRLIAGQYYTEFTVQCPYAIRKIGPFPDLSHSVRGCCKIVACYHKKELKPEEPMLPPPPPPPTYTPWNEWTMCDQSCGPGGARHRIRSCITEGRGPGGCEGPSFEAQVCDLKPCQDAGPQPWQFEQPQPPTMDLGQGPFVPFGGNQQNSQPPMPPKFLQIPQVKPEGPTLPPPPPPPAYSPWNEWSMCDKTCGPGGVKYRFRNCETEGRGPGECEGPAFEVEDCELGPCQEPWQFEQFQPPTVKPDQEPFVEFGGFANDQQEDSQPTVPPKFIQIPQPGPDGLLPPTYSEWGDWTSCDRTCGTDGFKYRFRMCQKKGRSPGDCVGEDFEYNACYLLPCSVGMQPVSEIPSMDGFKTANFEEHLTPTETPVPSMPNAGSFPTQPPTAEAQTTPPPPRTTQPPQTTQPDSDMPSQEEIQFILNQLIDQQNNGGDIDGGSAQDIDNILSMFMGSENVNTPEGPGFGLSTGESGAQEFPTTDDAPEYSDWSEWTPCDKTCGGGLKIRMRTCLNYEADSQRCEEYPTETEECHTQSCNEGEAPDAGNLPILDLSQFPDFTMPSSGPGEQAFGNSHDNSDENSAEGNQEETSFVQVEYGYSPWNEWSECVDTAVQCTGIGNRRRTRKCYAFNEDVYDLVEDQSECGEHNIAETEECMVACFPDAPGLPEHLFNGEGQDSPSTDEQDHSFPGIADHSRAQESPQSNAALSSMTLPVNSGGEHNDGGDIDDGEWFLEDNQPGFPPLPPMALPGNEPGDDGFLPPFVPFSIDGSEDLPPPPFIPFAGDGGMLPPFPLFPVGGSDDNGEMPPLPHMPFPLVGNSADGDDWLKNFLESQGDVSDPFPFFPPSSSGAEDHENQQNKDEDHSSGVQRSLGGGRKRISWAKWGKCSASCADGKFTGVQETTLDCKYADGFECKTAGHVMRKKRACSVQCP